jgi:hypothetical protein
MKHRSTTALVAIVFVYLGPIMVLLVLTRLTYVTPGRFLLFTRVTKVYDAVFVRNLCIWKYRHRTYIACDDACRWLRCLLGTSKHLFQIRIPQHTLCNPRILFVGSE